MMSDNWLESLRKETDAQALFQLWQDIRKYLHYLASRSLDQSLASKVDASDIAQHSLIEMQCDFHRFQGNSDAELKVWLERLVLHNVKDTSRRFIQSEKRNIRREKTFHDGDRDPLTDDTQSPSDIFVREESDVRLSIALNRLPSSLRQLIEMKYRNGLSISRIAILTNSTDYKVGNQIDKAISTLRRELADLE
jgi:RNA polymerase sigma-70 factor (subfamily 1)